MSRNTFSLQMTKTEKIIGWIYFPIHVFLLFPGLAFLNSHLFPKLGFAASDAALNVVYYAIGFLYVLILMWKYLKSSFHSLCDNFKSSITSMLIGYIAYNIMLYLVALVLVLVLGDISNPNQTAIINETKLNPGAMLAVGIFLAPIVEEILFRGVVFGTIRKKSRIIAYIISILAFAFYHLWTYYLTGFDWTFLLYLIQYVPAGIILAKCYEDSGSIWTSIFLHMLINFITLRVEIG